MIRAVSKEVFIPANSTAIIIAELIEKIDTIGPFSIQTASPGGTWGEAVQQLPKDAVVPNVSKTATFHGVVSSKEKKKQVAFLCYYETWIRVVQYLSSDQIPCVYATIGSDETKWQKLKRFFRGEKALLPQERVY